MDFKGRTICITGGSRGIGRALCDHLAQRQADSILSVGRSRGDLPETIGGTLISFIEVDLSQPDGAEHLARILETEHSNCSVLINNAGSQLMTDCVAPDAGESADMLAREIQLNFTTPITLGMRLMPLLLRQKNSAICNITSGLALAPKQSAPVYCATKAGLSSYTRALRYQADLRAANLKIFEALPPLVDTDMTKGRGSGKISADECARQIVKGMENGREVIDVGKSKLLRRIMRISPALGYRIMRNG
ncbi:putative oxidoreductase DltE [Altererythrobacter insulae]|nr:putative oxidoreductase DltE [Altererythrobacter insulae]